MMAITPAAARAAAVVLCVASASCSKSSSEDGPFDFAGTWEGVLVAGPDSTSRSTVFLTQRGDAVTGSISSEAALLGKADGATLSFTLDFAGVCGAAATGSGTVERLADRDRLHLAYQGTSTCSGVIGAAGSFDRMRCPAPTSACFAGYAEVDPRPYCADLSRDAANCGMCGRRCDGDLQLCVSGSCQVPACSGPIPLEAPRTFPAASTLWSLVLADVDRDGALDAIASGAMLSADVDSVVAVLRNDGSGGFSSRTATSLSSLFPGAPVYIPSAIAAGDLDGDGRLDLAAYVGSPSVSQVHATSELVTLLGNGDGTFRAGERFALGPDELADYVGPRAVAVADLNGDGAADVAARLGEARAVQVRLAAGDGTLGPVQEYAVAEAVDAIAAADLDADGTVDLAVAYEWSGGGIWDRGVSVLAGNGDGTFRAAVASPGVYDPQDLVVADVDEDGTPDLVVLSGRYAGWGGPIASVLLGNGDGTFAGPYPLNVEPPSSAFTLAVADLDADGHLDLAAGDRERGLELFLGHGDGTFAPFEHPIPSGAGLVAAADVDGDGRTELVVSDPGGGMRDVAVYRACSP